jgi:hypothetical protein
MRFVVPCICRCSDPMTRPSDSADRIKSESSSRDAAGLRAGTTFVSRLQAAAGQAAFRHQPLVGCLPLTLVIIKARASRLRRRGEKNVTWMG